MRIALHIIFLFLSNVLAGQIFDNFSDNNLSDNVVWRGDVSSFAVDPSQRMRLNASGAGTSFIYTDYSFQDSFDCSVFVKMEFNPSGANYTRLYFLLDSPDLTKTNGYFVQLGENGAEDAIRFYKVVAGQNTILGSGQLGSISKDSVGVILKIKSNGYGAFTIEGDHNMDGVSEDIFLVQDQSFKPSIGKLFGMQCVYSATRKDKIAFDDVSIQSFNNDKTPPSIVSVILKDQKKIDVQFSEAVEKSSAEVIGHYVFNPSIIVEQVNLTAANTASILLQSPLISDLEYTLSVKNIRDINGNILVENTNKIIYISPVKYGDLVISELLFDPYTNQQDFVELYNTTSKDIDIKGYKIENRLNGQSQVIASSLVVKAATFMALSSSIPSVQATYSPPAGAVITTQNLPAMNNDRGNLTLLSTNGVVIDSFTYTDAIHTIDIRVKKVDGVSLEKIDLVAGKNLYNWMSCELVPKYATPGYTNSNKSDLLKPSILSTSSLTENQIILVFNDVLNRASMANTLNYFINNGIGQPISAEFYNVHLRQVLLTFDEALSPSNSYVITIKGVMDKNGNIMDAASIPIAYGAAPGAGDLVLSEILFYPNTGGQDFVELYNPTEKNIQLANLQITNSANQQTKTLVSHILYPHAYVAITEDTASTKTIYATPDTAHFLKQDLPSFNLDEGNVAISFGGVVIDSFTYSEDNHHQLIDNADAKGISLEKINLTVFSNTDNWHSASKDVNYATPGYKNSASFNLDSDASASFDIADRVFTPNGDGDKDNLIIEYRLDQPGYIANAKIFSGDGYLVKELAQNELLGTHGTLRWDGTNSDGRIEKMGIYIIVGDLFSIEGKTQKFKLSCVLGLR